jgi:superfamily II DNA or RNA helicase
MKAIKLNSTTIQLEFDNQAQRESLANMLSYKIPGCEYSAAYQAKRWSGLKCYLTPTNRVKIGLFKSLFPKHSLVFDKNFKSLTFDDIPLYKNNPKFERRQYQLDAINSILQNKYGICAAIMGSGKSLISAAVISYHLSLNPKNKTLFIVYDKNILQQSIKNFTSYGFKVSQFGDNIKDISGDIIVGTIQSLNNLEKPKQVLKNISFVFSDESHHSGSKTSRKVMSKLPNCNYYIGLTATPFAEKTLELAELTASVGPVIYTYSYQDAVKDNKIVPVKAFFLDLPVDYDLKEQIYLRKNYKYIWDTAIQNNIKRNETIATILNSCSELLETPNLILVDRVEHGTQLYNTVKKMPKLTPSTMFGADDIITRHFKKTALMANNTNTMISTVISEGIDFAVSPVVAINATGRKSFIKLIQFLGRITRQNEKFKKFRVYIDIIDKEHPYLLAHSSERIEICKQFGIDVQVCSSIQELIVDIIKYYKETTKEE